MVVIHDIKHTLESLSKSSTVSLPTCKDNKLKIHFKETTDVSTEYNGKEPPLPFASSEVFYADICDWRRLTAVDDGCKSVYEITLNVAVSNFTFKPGDTIGIIPLNKSSEVEDIIDHLNLSAQADLEYTLGVNSGEKGSKVPLHIPARSTLRHALTYCCDIRSVMKKIFLLALSKHTKEDNERRILEYLCSKEGSCAYNTHILNQQFCILDLFSTFKSCRPPIEVLLANLPRLLPRPYSIVNSGLVDSSTIKICFSVTELESRRKGVVTGWLESIINNKSNNIEEQMKSLAITEGSDRIKVPIYLRKNMSGFSCPDNTETPLILIGPGTGVSPFLGFLEERKYVKENNSEVKLGDIWLFFGCRNPKLDFIYEEELNEYLDCGILSNLSTSFSRIENCDVKYIQDALIKNGEDIVKLIEQGAMIFVCGDVVQMAPQVKDALTSCLVQHGERSRPEAETLLSDLQTGRRYLVDAWS